MKISTKNVKVMYKRIKKYIYTKYYILSDSEKYCEGKLKRKWKKSHGEKDYEIFIL